MGKTLETGPAFDVCSIADDVNSYPAGFFRAKYITTNEAKTIIKPNTQPMAT